MSIKSKESDLFYLSCVLCSEIEDLEKEFEADHVLTKSIVNRFPEVQNIIKFKKLWVATLREGEKINLEE